MVNTNEIMQDGIRLVREGSLPEAYNAFREVVSNEPDNEFAWIWISVTSSDRAEKRSALNQALRINPDSQRARDALRNLDLEDRKSGINAVVPAAYGAPETAAIGAPPFNSNAIVTTEGDPLRAALTEVKKPKKVKEPKVAKMKTVKTVKTVSQTTTEDDTTVTAKPKRSGIRLLIYTLAAALALLLVLLLIQVQRNQTTPDPAPADAGATPTSLATSPDTGTVTTSAVTSGAATTGVATAAVTSAGLITPSPPGSPLPVGTNTNGNITSGIIATPVATVPVPGSPGAVTTNPAGGTPANVAQEIQNAQASLTTGDYAAARTSYLRAINSDPRSVPANLGFGNFLMIAPGQFLPADASRYQLAAQYFRVVTVQSPNWAGGYARLGEALAGTTDTKAAIAAFTKSLELDPNGPERWLALAALYDKENQPDQAKFARERAQNLLAPGQPRASSTNPPATAVPTPTVRR